MTWKTSCEKISIPRWSLKNFHFSGFYLAKVGQSCAELCSAVGDDFACIRLLNTYDRMQPFLNAIDANDYTKLANIECSSHPQTDDYQKPSDPSFEISANRCRGYKNLTLIDCHAVGGNEVRRLCKCVDKGISLNRLGKSPSTSNVTEASSVSAMHYLCHLNIQEN